MHLIKSTKVSSSNPVAFIAFNDSSDIRVIPTGDPGPGPHDLRVDNEVVATYSTQAEAEEAANALAEAVADVYEL